MARVTSVRDFVEVVESRVQSFSLLWFRGVSRSSHGLIPSLFRVSGCSTSDDYLEREERVLNLFKQRSLPYIESNIMERVNFNDWNYLFMMQHFGIPTRLLDWSENALTALYFAVSTAIKDTESEVDASVWVLDPKGWNSSVLRGGTATPDVLNPTDSVVDSYRPGQTAKAMAKAPIAIYGDYNSKRIAAQQGVFILFGAYSKAMDLYISEFSMDSNVLARIDIPKENVTSIYNTLRKIGFTESAVYPDLQGLSLDLGRVARGDI